MGDYPRYLYHGTSAAAARIALKEGIRPRKHHRKSNWKRTIESNPDTVYLTDAYPLYFAFNAAKGKQMGAVLQIDTSKLDHLWLVPDEDVLEQAGRSKDDIPGNMKQRTRHYRDNIRNYLATDAWLTSLKAMGTCGSLKPIPPDAITRVAWIDPEQCPQLVMDAIDAMITLANYRFCGPKYRNMTNRLFGLDMEGDPLHFDVDYCQLLDNPALDEEQRQQMKTLLSGQQEYQRLLAENYARIKVEEVNP